MNLVEEEWKKLKEHLVPGQEQDGRRCFYAGVLHGLCEIMDRDASEEKLQAILKEIKNELGFGEFYAPEKR